MPEWEPAIRARLRGLNLAGAREAEIVEELARHVDDRYLELLAEGLSPERARLAALDELESEDYLARELRTTRQPCASEPRSLGSGGGGNIMESIWQDVKVAFRMIRL